ncbi:hypothetical protein L873DRAFT_1746270 [Choiromyces venosus 120613-1]|uniref:Crinkler family protein n=1 Tax=Choiromyces venosus 120613-1 TaxID=1336337 RepID=A0A3N4J973_9PEZI|nr:hypothetical protein L873DRAFT_1746270 [Choiromyces venosus 120613-1]
MQKDMQDLYNELWGKPLPIIQEFRAQVPLANYGIHPGYKITMRSSEMGTFAPPQFESKRQEQVFRMVEVRVNLPCGMRKLLVRPEYDKVRDRLIRAEAARWQGVGHSSGNPAVRRKLDYEISGQPGTGKTCFLSYLLVRRLHKCQPTVYRADDKSCFLFDEDSAGNEISVKTLSCLSPAKKRKLWVLTDETLQNPQWHRSTSGWFVVLAASPKKVKACRQWEKERNVALYFMSNWEWPEIFAAYCLELEEPPTQDQINKLFTTFACLGPVAGTCLKLIDVTSDELYNESLEIYLSQVDREIEGFIAHGGRETIAHTVHQDSSHRMAIMHPTQTGLSYTARIITRWMAYRVYEKALERSQHDCFLLFKHLSRQPTLRSVAGCFFEGYVHDWFLQGGTFNADEIPIIDSTVPQFEFNTTKAESGTPNYFTTPGNLADQVRAIGGRGINPAVVQRYFLPYSRNYPSVDGLLLSDVKTLLLLQITLAQRHEIKSPGVAELLKSLPKTIKNVYFVFVVPEDRAEDYSRAQPVPDSGTISPSGANLHLRQFRLVFKEDSMQAVAIQGLLARQEVDESD